MKKNKENLISTILFFILFMLTFLAIGLYSGMVFHDTENDLLFFINLTLSYVIYLISIVVHEFGHMIFGLMSGYTFSSFRVFNFMILNDNGKLVFKKMSVAGTAGQCIMMPKDNKTPFVLYNLGGVILNLICFAISIGLLFVVKNDFVKVLLFDFGVFNLFDAITNGIPLKYLVSNDMNNIVEFKKDKRNLDNYYNMLYIQNAIISGKRLKDLDKKYIHKPEKLTTVGDVNEMVFYCNQLIDKGEYDKAIKEIESFVDNDKVSLVYRGLLVNDLIYCYAILGKDINKALKYKDDTVKSVLMQMKDNPSVIRTNYAYALLIDKNKEEADKYMEQFNKIKKSYPYKVEIDSELELIELAKEKNK